MATRAIVWLTDGPITDLEEWERVTWNDTESCRTIFFPTTR